MKALVVDDSQAMRALNGAVLAEFGFEVHEAASGGEALASMLNEGPFALCMVGWNLSDISGTDLVRIIRIGKVQESAPRILMITSETSRAKVLEALTAGSDEYLEEPFSSDMLVGKLSILRLLPRYGAPLPA